MARALRASVSCAASRRLREAIWSTRSLILGSISSSALLDRSRTAPSGCTRAAARCRAAVAARPRCSPPPALAPASTLTPRRAAALFNASARRGNGPTDTTRTRTCDMSEMQTKKLAFMCVCSRGSQPFCGPAAASRRGSAEGDTCDRSGFIPACSRCRFFAEMFLNLFVDKVVPELLLLDCAAEPAPRG